MIFSLQSYEDIGNCIDKFTFMIYIGRLCCCCAFDTYIKWFPASNSFPPRYWKLIILKAFKLNESEMTSWNIRCLVHFILLYRHCFQLLLLMCYISSYNESYTTTNQLKIWVVQIACYFIIFQLKLKISKCCVFAMCKKVYGYRSNRKSSLAKLQKYHTL